MPRINLLPWRDTLRKEREQRFLLIMGTFLALTGMIFGAVHFYIVGMIDYQYSRNNYLRSEIKRAEEQIEEIKTLDEKKAQLIKRMEAIQELEENRPLVVHLFDELVRKLPEGVYFTKFEQKGAQITLTGSAQSDARVSSLMTNLKSSQWLTSPKILIIEKKDKNADKKGKTHETSDFILEVTQVVPKNASAESDAKKDDKKPPDGKTPPPPPAKK